MHDNSGADNSIFSRIPSFSIILIMIVLIVVGAAMIPLLNIQYAPSTKERSMSINFSWNGASARVVEQEVTSKIEGLVSSINGVRSTSSVSRKDGGSVNITLKEGVNVDAVRFEISSLMRRIYSKLPEGVSYPILSLSTTGERSRPILTYTINAEIPARLIEDYAENIILKNISRIKGVNSVILSGATPFYIELAFDPDKLRNYDINISEISQSINTFMGRSDIVGIAAADDSPGREMMIMLNAPFSRDFDAIAVKNINGRIITVGDLTTISYKEQKPSWYYRINGLNTINVTIYPEKYVNTLILTAEVKAEMNRLKADFPAGYSVIIADDSSVYIKEELNKIVLRTVLSVLILMIFVFIVSRSLRYLFIIIVTLVANIFIAFIFYNLFSLEIHLYSLAGITVSLGIIIDTSIIMIDHYSYYRNRRVFVAILAALLTTIGSLTVVKFLPEADRANLVDFSAVIIINLAISLVVALIFVPALMDKLPIIRRKGRRSIRIKRRVVKFNRLYTHFILWGKRHKWAFIVVAIFAFGTPVHMLPAKLDIKKDDTTCFQRIYIATIGGNTYQNKLKKWLEPSLGGTMRLFSRSIQWNNYFREPSRQTLTINAGLPEGCTVQQLNDIMVMMENFLSQFDEIESFKTTITSYDRGTIDVTFKKEYENGSFPMYLKNAAISKAANYGGANWSVYGIDENGFNNNISSGYKSYRIALMGYNYDQLYRYASDLKDSLSLNRRISEPEIYGNVGWGSTISRNEFFIRYNPEKIALYNISLNDTYNSLRGQLYSQRLQPFFDGENMIDIELVSSDIDNFDVWHLKNQYIDINNKSIKFSEIGTVDKRRTGNDIYKRAQQYTLIVAYDFIGPYELGTKVTELMIERLFESLPMGYKAHVEGIWWNNDGGSQYWLLVLIALIIYFICSILFESLLQPLVIVLLIPISFIGVFLTFSLTGFRFDQGGFASFILLSGIVVNAGIYIINEYNNTLKSSGMRGMRNYIHSFSHKIIPIFLTVLSTILGLLPFLYDGQSEVFWFSFAIGTIGGLIFSVVALIVYMPVFMPCLEKRS